MKNDEMISERTSEEEDRQLKTAFANSLKKSHRKGQSVPEEAPVKVKAQNQLHLKDC